MEKEGMSKAYASFTVTEPARLLAWLLANVRESRSKVKATLQGGGIKVGGKVVTQFDFPLQPGMRVEVSRSKQNQEFKNRYIRIVFEDRYVIIVDKRPGILSMPAGHSSLNVKTVLDDYFLQTRQHCQAHVVHRLDRDTSGLMIYAKDKQTEMTLEADWHNIVFDRRYVAVLSGIMEHDGGTIQNWLKDNRDYFTYSSPDDNGGKLAITHLRVLDRTRPLAAATRSPLAQETPQSQDGYSLVEFRLETGRKNQIRVHAADMGHPVCGDVKYGNGDDPIGRLCLHAYRLCFYHPVTHRPMSFETDFPKAFTDIFKRRNQQ